MPEKQSLPPETEQVTPEAQNGSSPGGTPARGEGKAQSASNPSFLQRAVRTVRDEVIAFLRMPDKETAPEPPPPEKTLRETVRGFSESCRDREKRIAMLKGLGDWSWKLFFRGTVFFFLFVLTIWSTIRALEFSEKHRVKFFPPVEVLEYLAAEHETLEAAASDMTPLVGKEDDIPFGRFDAKFIETVKPIRIHSDEYGIYFMTSRSLYNGEHGIFIAKEEENMPPDISWGLIEGRIYAYALYD